MKKIGFLSSLAAVALMSMTLVGCEKEKIDINGSINGSEVVIPSTNAKVVVAYTVQDAATGNEVAGAKIYVDGVAIATNPVTYENATSLAEKTLVVVASADGYFPVTRKVYLPAVSAGQHFYVPVVISMKSVSSEDANEAVVAETDDADPATAATDKSNPTSQDFSSLASATEDVTVNLVVKDVPAGTRYADIDALKAKVQALTAADAVATTRAEGDVDADLITAKALLLKNIEDHSNWSNTTDITIEKVTIPAGATSVKVDLFPTTVRGKMTISALVNNKLYSVDGEYEEVINYYAEVVSTMADGHSHTHSHGHDHGGSNNAGGGEGSAE